MFTVQPVWTVRRVCSVSSPSSWLLLDSLEFPVEPLWQAYNNSISRPNINDNRNKNIVANYYTNGSDAHIAQIIQLYSSGGANVHPCLIMVPWANVIRGHLAMLRDDTPAHYKALRRQIDTFLGQLPDNTWKRAPGRQRCKWLDQIRPDNNFPPSDLWRCAAIRRVHSAVTQRSHLARDDDYTTTKFKSDISIGSAIFA